MSFDISYRTGNYGDGHNGELILAAKNKQINEYAKVTAINGKKITITNVSNSEAFSVGTLVMIHVAGYSGSANFAYSGYWKISRITAIEGDTITIKKNCNGMTGNNSYAIFQAITIPEYTSVTLPKNTSLTCPQFNETLGYGGVVAFLCSGELNFNGGHINLNGKGLPDNSLRGLFKYEADSDNHQWNGYENYKRRLTLPINYPDGSAFIVAKSMNCDEDSRIGNINSDGIARTPMSLDTADHGGANIFIAAETISNFSPKMISKKPSITSGGKGWGGCYIATESILPNDEGLYAYDRISTPERMSETFKIKDYGNGINGAPDAKQVLKQLNSYAAISAIDKTRTIFTIVQTNNNGIAKIQEGALVMIRADRKAGGYYAGVGRFIITEVLSIKNTNKVQVKHALPDFNGNLNLNHYNFQMIAIPQFTDFTLKGTNSKTPAYDTEKGCGGLLAIAVNGTCDLSGGGKLLVEEKGGCPATGSSGLNFISNAQMAEKLPIGEGNGSVFILANNLIVDKDTRIGASWSGAGFGGSEEGDGASVYGWGGSYARDGSGAGNGTAYGLSDGVKINRNGGYNTNSLSTEVGIESKQGAHIMIIANKITGLNISCLSTGGQGGNCSAGKHTTGYRGGNGGCGYGGAGGYFVYDTSPNDKRENGDGGYIGGGAGNYSEKVTGKDANGVSYSDWVDAIGGGSGAFCFIYCNKVDSQNTKDIYSD